MANTIRDLRDERFQLAERAKTILEGAANANRTMNPEERSEWTKLHDEIDALGTRVTDAERQQAIDGQMHERALERADKEGRKVSEVKSDEEEYREVFSKYLRFGSAELAPEDRKVLRTHASSERRAGLTAGTGSSGGFTVPTGFYDQLIDAQKAFGGMRASGATIFATDNGETINIPLDNDTTNKGSILTEGSTIAELDPVFTQKAVGAYMYTSGLVAVSFQLLQDSKFDVEAWLRKQLAIRIGRITNDHFTTGTGAAQPSGIVTGATLGTTGATGQTLTVVYKDLVELEHSVDPAYRTNASGVATRWMFADSTLRVIKELTDTTNRPLWRPGISASFQDKEPDTILGYPYVINQSVAVMAANAKSILFGDFSTYLIRDVDGATVLRLDERYADNLQVGFFAFERHDGLLLNAGTNPVQFYANSAT